MTIDVVLGKVPISLVHKEFDDDVLVANMRGLLPSWLPAHVIDEPGLSSEEREGLRTAYGIERFDLPDADRVLALCSLPPSVRSDRVAQLAKEPLEAVSRCYVEKGDHWVIGDEYVSELDHVILMNHLVDRSAHLSDEDRFRLSRALDKVPSLKRPQVSCFNMVMDTTNYFFYRKHHDHVPGIMLIEVVRQTMYAQYYRYSRLAKGQVSLTIENLNVNFMGFVNANYPARIQVEDVRSPETIAGDTCEERVATISQLGRIVARASMRANPIKMNLFKRLRNIKPPAEARFIPQKNIAPVGIFTWQQGVACEGRIRDVSTEGIKVSFDDACVIELGAQARLSMFVEGVGFINATVEARWIQSNDGCRVVGLKMVEIDSVATLRLREAIKNFTFVDTSRGEC
jgi:hypothetical protein